MTSAIGLRDRKKAATRAALSAAAVRLARTSGRALVSLRVPQAERDTVTKALAPVLADPPDGVRLLVINDASFQDNGTTKVNIEVLAVRRGGAR